MANRRPPAPLRVGGRNSAIRPGTRESRCGGHERGAKRKRTSAAKRTLTAVFGLEAWAPSQLPPGRLEEEPTSASSSSSRHVCVLMSSRRPRPPPMTRSQRGGASAPLENGKSLFQTLKKIVNL